jgi:hypothetical protein
MGVSETTLSHAFAKRLTIMVGELDNENETGGTLLRSDSADRQGLHRLARGRYFFEEGRKEARRISTPFHWDLVVVDDVGHDYRAMGEAASELLY